MPETLTEKTITGTSVLPGIIPGDHDIAKSSDRIDDRPGWIPPDILYDWDANPYAYQTEEELMPAGGLHGHLLNRFAEVVRTFLEKKGMCFLLDTFMLYRDKQGVKQRISPDLLIMPFRSQPLSAYDMDAEPPPLAVVEITSPKSRITDRETKRRLYMDLGIPVCLVIDAITSQGKPCDPELFLWRKTGGAVRKIKPDANGYLPIPEMHVKIKAEDRNLVVADIMTGEILRDKGEIEQSEAREKQRADQESKRADQERERANQETERAERLAAKLRELGIALEEME